MGEDGAYCEVCGTFLPGTRPGQLRICPGCGVPVVGRGAAPSDEGVIEVEAEVVGGPPRGSAPPPGAADDGGPRVHTRVERDPFGVFERTTVIIRGGGARPLRPGCCGVGCLAIVLFAAYVFLRGLASLF